MSFLSKIFGSSKEKEKTFDIDKNFKESYVLPLGYQISTIEKFLIENAKNSKELKELINNNHKEIENMLYELFVDKVNKWSWNNTINDEYRPNEANKHGGIDFKNKEIIKLLRGISTDIISQVGRKILSGDFNLTTISFPIKVMIPISILQSLARTLFQYPFYMFNACDKDPLEKMRITVVASLAGFYCSAVFLKPINPILGETYECMFSDGSKMYLEQTSHHPPISHYQLIGKNYKINGYSTFKSSAGLNSLSVTNLGKRIIEFKDGTKIEFNHAKESFSGTFFGTPKLESLGELKYIDEKNKIICKIKIGEVKGKPTDFLYGEIFKENKKISVLTGSYLSALFWDDVKYWDIRDNFPITILDYSEKFSKYILPSSSIHRSDRRLLELNMVEEAQEMKEKLENIQRKDKKLREKK